MSDLLPKEVITISIGLIPIYRVVFVEESIPYRLATS